MPTKSSLPAVDIPNVDIWDFMFERKDRPFPDDKGKPIRSSVSSARDLAKAHFVLQ
jgi:hypothetical protein